MDAEDEAVFRRSYLLELVTAAAPERELPAVPAEVTCRKCRALVCIDVATPEEIFRACGNVGQREQRRSGLVTHKYHPPCPWMPRHPEFGPTPPEGWPETEGEPQ